MVHSHIPALFYIPAHRGKTLALALALALDVDTITEDPGISPQPVKNMSGQSQVLAKDTSQQTK